MNCPMSGCDNAVERGPNTYIEVELADKSIRKLVCEECANLHYDHLTA